MEIKKFLVGKEWKTSSEISDVINPYTNQVYCQVYNAQKEDFDLAIIEGLKAFEKTKKLSRYKKSEILKNIYQLVEKNTDKFVEYIIKESGKPITYAKAEVTRAIITFKMASEEVLKFGGELLPLDVTAQTENYKSITERFPLGVIAGISPFNFPLNLAVHKVAPAIATGNSMILKPPPQAPSASLLLGEICLEAGLPEGSLSVLPASNNVADMLVTDERIKMLSFTGSAKVGWDMKNRAGKKKVCLELGGNASVIVHSDADLAFAIPRIAIGGYSYAGQVCISVQRILVHKPIYEEFKTKFVDYVKNNVKFGNPEDASTVIGPLINKPALERTSTWIKNAVDKGSNLLLGGNYTNSVFEPTILENVPVDCEVCCEEVFAPITVLIPYDNFEESIAITNNSKFGLQAGVFTKNIDSIFYAHHNLEVGGVIINDYPTFRVDNMPYGGIKDSGFGREGIKYAMEDMTELKVTVFRL
ncbi:MAG: aldehyde dehydrogenase family protein [Candidatus Sericytochromatia bacterium]